MNATIMTAWLFAMAADPLPADKVPAVLCHEVSSYCEGIVFDQQNYGYVSHGKVITRFKVDPSTGTPVGPTEVWAETGGPNGHKVLADGTHLVCDHSRHAVLKLDAAGKVIGVASDACAGKKLRGPNDLTLDVPNGGFYFTDPGDSNDKPIGTVHYTDRAGQTTLVADGMLFPNGIVISLDGKRLLVAESVKNRILEFPIVSPGKVGPLRVFAELPKKSTPDQVANSPDGICLDAAGRLYVAHYGMKAVQVLGLDGKLLHTLPGGNVTTSNVAFAPDRKTLYVTGGLRAEGGAGGVFRLAVFDHPGGLLVLPSAEKK